MAKSEDAPTHNDGALAERTREWWWFYTKAMTLLLSTIGGAALVAVVILMTRRMFNGLASDGDDYSVLSKIEAMQRQIDALSVGVTTRDAFLEYEMISLVFAVVGIALILSGILVALKHEKARGFATAVAISGGGCVECLIAVDKD